MNLIVNVTSERPQAAMNKLAEMPLGLDIWELTAEHAVVRAAEAQLERLEKMGYTIEQLQETEAFLSDFATEEAASGYHSAATLEHDMRALAQRFPEIAALEEIGRSVEKRPIWALRLGERKGSTTKIAFMGCHHAREWLAVEVPYLLAEHLLTNSTTDPVSTWLSTSEIWVAPMVNPDGHEHSRTTERLWRKNRRTNFDGTIGVDPNRNYGYMWGTLDIDTSSHTPADETYVGPRAFSEPETRAVRDLIGRELFAGVITYHSYSQLILYPWGYTRKPIQNAADRNAMATLATKMSTLIKAVHGKEYVAEQSSQLYPTAGDTTDWTYGVYGIPSFTIELRPRTAMEGGFILPASQIQPTFEENTPTARAFIAAVLD
ncbi:M14 family metallopeptidase [Rhodococcus sp. T2V]|uniref:M14 family metallopeptidase n=1 Tax=Rhodococcus sp. T2V TaxID=3034164 RepID=UPI0023E0DC25|nr:M14 family metallopeptidase [Rhodococcus sp. T2V]MDF3308892.1 M14 family metallopeptidase [Rhodococcus sp. T2V]